MPIHFSVVLFYVMMSDHALTPNMPDDMVLLTQFTNILSFGLSLSTSFCKTLVRAVTATLETA